MRRHADFANKRMADFGCGYDARLARDLLPQVASACLVDVHLAEDLKHDPKVAAMEGTIEEVLPTIEDASIDVVLCLSVLEHLS